MAAYSRVFLIGILVLTVRCGEEAVVEKLTSVDFVIARAIPTEVKGEYRAVTQDSISRRTRDYYLIMFTNFQPINSKGFWRKSVFPREHEILHDSLLSIRLFIKGGKETIDLNHSIKQAGSIYLRYGDHLNMINNSSFKGLVKDYNYAFSGEIDVDTRDYGDMGMFFKIDINSNSIPSKHRSMIVLEYLFKSGARIKKEKLFYFE